ncbi:GNAT family N-acetyltransferase [Micromonospora arida]|uniref:GNAT family N-acetyltransferase n=1 Tax=Micromonospora arida TaxID=2203715 RepID=UPI00268D28DE
MPPLRATVLRRGRAQRQRGYGWWAVEVQATGEFIGFAGLDDVDDDMPFTGVEIGWRLARSSLSQRPPTFVPRR